MIARPRGYGAMRANWSSACDAMFFTDVMYPSTRVATPPDPRLMATDLAKIRAALAEGGIDGEDDVAFVSPSVAIARLADGSAVASAVLTRAGTAWTIRAHVTGPADAAPASTGDGPFLADMGRPAGPAEEQAVRDALTQLDEGTPTWTDADVTFLTPRVALVHPSPTALRLLALDRDGAWGVRFEHVVP
jgi:hypothetical protein